MFRMIEAIRAKHRQVAATSCLIVGISGIDGSGKGYVSDRLVTRLRAEGLHAHVIHADGWLNLPPVRFSSVNPPAHFYRHAFRFDEMFDRLVLPLKATRSVRVVVDFTEETATAYRDHHYDMAGVDVTVVEAIFLFRPEYRRHFDLTVWIDCTFETALERALARAQEGLPLADTMRAYQELYFPAQRIHFDTDHPREVADIVLANDPRLGSAVA